MITFLPLKEVTRKKKIVYYYFAILQNYGLPDLFSTCSRLQDRTQDTALPKNNLKAVCADG